MLLIADTSPIISLILLNQLSLIQLMFKEYYLPAAVWDELNSHQEIAHYKKDLKILKSRVKKVKNQYMTFPGIDAGETEAIILYQETKADALLIDDKKARSIAEMLEIKCFGTLSILISAKKKKYIKDLRPLFLQLLHHKRYFSRNLLNEILTLNDEDQI
jgi:uncharacterized protein